jgi:hypothetical protein
MVTWANSSRGSRLDYQCTLFLSEMMAYMQGSIETYEQTNTHPPNNNNYPQRNTYSNWIWRQLTTKTPTFEMGGGYVEPTIDTPTNPSLESYFNSFNLYSSSTFLDTGEMIVMMPSRYPSERGYYSYGSGDSIEIEVITPTGEVSVDFGNQSLYVFTIIQYYIPGDLVSEDNLYLQYCNRRSGDFILDISTGEITELGWIYDYGPGQLFSAEYRIRSEPVKASSPLLRSGKFTWDSRLIILQGISYFALNYPSGMPL